MSSMNGGDSVRRDDATITIWLRFNEMNLEAWTHVYGQGSNYIEKHDN